MISPFKPAGIGMTDTVNVFKVTFSQSLSDIPILTAYDDYNVSSVSNTIFSGTASLPIPLLAGVGGTAPGVADWYPATASEGNSTAGTPNVLKATVNGCKLSTTTPTAGVSVLFNIGYKFPYDVTTLATMGHIIAIEYQYTGTVPNLTFYGNSGTVGTPTWTTIDTLPSGTAPSTNNVTQIRPCDTGRGNDGDTTYRQAIPQTGTTYPDEIWLTNF